MKVILSIAFLLYVAGAQAAEYCRTLSAGQFAVVVTSAAAVAAAKPALVKQFTAKEIAKFKPFKAELQGDIWHVYGRLPPDNIGGTPEADVCRATGRIVRVYHSQ